LTSVAVDGPHRHPGDQLVDGALLHLDLAEGGKDGRDVREEGCVRADDQHAGAAQSFAVQIQQIGGAVQADRGLTGAGGALDADRVLEVGAHQLVLFGLDCRDDVAHRADAGALDLGGQDATLRAEFLAAVQVLVLEAGQLAFDEAEPAAGGDALRIAHAGPIERAGERRAPVEHHGLAGVVGDVAATHVVRRLVDVEAPEEERRGRVVGQLGHPAGQLAAQRLGGEGVAGHVGAGGEEILGAAAHPAERGAGLGEVFAFGAEFVIQVDSGHGSSSQAHQEGCSAFPSGLRRLSARGRPLRCMLTTAVKRSSTLRRPANHLHRINRCLDARPTC
jgi:hypothetical protein